MLRISIQMAAGINFSVRNLSGRAVFPSRYFAACNDHSALHLLRNGQGWWISCLGAKSFSNSSKPHVIEILGLDADSNEEEVVGFFKSLNIKPAKVRLRCDHSGRVAGTCEVEFSTYAEAVVAMRKRNSFIGNRFIRLRLKSSNVSDEKFGVLKANGPRSAGDTNMPDAPYGITKNLSSTGHFIRMKGLPLRITEQAIFDFFWPVNVRPISVQQVHDDNGRPTKKCDVEFLTHEEAVRAMSKNNAYFGSQFVELTLKSTADETHSSDIQTSTGISNNSQSSSFEKQNIGQ